MAMSSGDRLGSAWSTAASLCGEAIGVAQRELLDIRFKDVRQGQSSCVEQQRDVPEDIAQFLLQLLLVQVVSLEEMLLDVVCDFARLPSQP